MEFKFTSNKKLIIGLCAGLLAAIAIIVAIVIIASNVDFKSGGGGDAGTSFGTLSDGASSSEEGKDTPSSSSTQISSGVLNSETTSQATITTEKDVTAKAGDTVKIAVKITENPSFWGAQYFFKYDSSVLEYKGFEKGKIFEEYDVVDLKTESQVRAIINLKDAVDTDKTGTVVTLLFKVKNDTPKGTYTVDLVGDSLFTTIDEELVNVKINIPQIKVK